MSHLSKLTELVKRGAQLVHEWNRARNTQAQDPSADDVAEAIKLLSWFAEIDDPDLDDHLARVVAAKLRRSFLIAPHESVRPTNAILRKVRAEMMSDPMPMRTVQNLKMVLRSSA